jgi:hypothetical protein
VDAVTNGGKMGDAGRCQSDKGANFLLAEAEVAISFENFVASREGLFPAYIAAAPEGQTFFCRFTAVFFLRGSLAESFLRFMISVKKRTAVVRYIFVFSSGGAR